MVREPSKKWFLIPVLIFLVGAVVTAWLGISSYQAFQKPKSYISLPGEGTATVQEAGRVEIFYEYQITPQLANYITFTFTNRSTGSVAVSTPPTYTGNYAIGGRNGILIAMVDIPEPGDYLVTSDYAPGSPEVDIVVGNLFAMGGVVSGIMAVLVGVFTLLGALLLSILLSMRYNKVKKKHEEKGYSEAEYNGPEL